MPTITPQIDPERPLEPEQPRSSDSPLTFVPHDANGSKPIRTIRTGRYGELEEHELIRLLDTIEDERARGRFRESIYISLFVWMAIAWVVLYGPRYLWHAPQLVNPADVLREREMVQLNAPHLPHVPAPTAHPTPKPTLDNKTLEHLRRCRRLRSLSPSRRTSRPPSPRRLHRRRPRRAPRRPSRTPPHRSPRRAPTSARRAPRTTPFRMLSRMLPAIPAVGRSARAAPAARSTWAAWTSSPTLKA
jgi:hypothetical protein